MVYKVNKCVENEMYIFLCRYSNQLLSGKPPNVKKFLLVCTGFLIVKTPLFAQEFSAILRNQTAFYYADNNVSNIKAINIDSFFQIGSNDTLMFMYPSIDAYTECVTT